MPGTTHDINGELKNDPATYRRASDYAEPVGGGSAPIDAKDKARDSYVTAKDKASDAWESAKDRISDSIENIKTTTDKLIATAQRLHTMHPAADFDSQEPANKSWDSTKGSISEAYGSTSDKGVSECVSATGKIDEIKREPTTQEKVEEAWDKTKDKANEAYVSAKVKIHEASQATEPTWEDRAVQAKQETKTDLDSTNTTGKTATVFDTVKARVHNAYEKVKDTLSGNHNQDETTKV